MFRLHSLGIASAVGNFADCGEMVYTFLGRGRAGVYEETNNTPVGGNEAVYHSCMAQSAA